MRIGIVGLGVVGGAIQAYFPDSIGYDKYKPSASFEEIVKTDIVFLCLPTLFDPVVRHYDHVPIRETLHKLAEASYAGLVVLKSTVEPGTTRSFATEFPSLRLCHSPEFLSARTAVEDFRSQRVLIVGKAADDVSIDSLLLLFPNVPKTIVCSSDESEATKLFCNSFYAAKIQIFNEFYDACKKTNMNFSTIRDMMIALGWIHPMHTEVPGTDGKLSFGGMCFPKDISACVEFLESKGALADVLRAALTERNKMRTDYL